ncbi:MAG TPA: hypothetical protein VGK23_03645 [Methanomassiliicoccales archaeon]|jgi:hypothetical protein
MGLNGIAFAMIGLVYGLCHWIFFCSGTEEAPNWWRKKSTPEDMVPEQPIGAMGSLVAGISLFLFAFWLIWNPGSNQFLVMAISGIMNGLLFMGTAVVAVKGWDWKHIGNGAIAASVAQTIMIPFAVYWGFPADAGFALLVWGILAGSWGLVIHGKSSLKLLQLSLVLSVVASWWFMVFYGNIHRPLSMVTNLDNSISGGVWALVFAIVGGVCIVWLAIGSRRGARPQDMPQH